jgi:D-alanyl-D-alanine carboxypeptidase/D-alanyl-D-alanine-endopeptidase (penicillin-binding protein 4)
MPPASTLKLLTSLVALERLGPAWRARTLLRTRGKIVDGVLGGDLVLQGGGDVDFDWLAFERQLALLRLRGVREIRGDLILDLTRFRPSRSDIGVAPFDESPEFRYNVVPDALLLNTYLLQLDIASTTEAVHVVSTPLLDRVSVVPELDLIDGPCEDWEDGWKPPVVDDRRGTMTIRLRGTFPRECVASTAVNVLDRGAYADRLFRALWKRLGGKFTGHVRESIGPSYARVIGEHSSRPLAQVLWDVNKRSDNPITRVTYLNLGATSGDEPEFPTAQRAERVVRSWLAAHGIETRGLVLDNGSGLSRTERIAASDLAAVLRVGASSRWSAEFLATLPIVAIDGGMRRRLPMSDAAGRARIKTGTLRDVSAVAGYVEDRSGETHIVVAMIHHPLARREVARPILDSLIDWVARRDMSQSPANVSTPLTTRSSSPTW